VQEYSNVTPKCNQCSQCNASRKEQHAVRSTVCAAEEGYRLVGGVESSEDPTCGISADRVVGGGEVDGWSIGWQWPRRCDEEEEERGRKSRATIVRGVG
jgi:hypothetical protein